MASSIQLLRSNNAQERPFPGNLLDGQPAINTNPQEPGLFFKANDGTVIKIGPAAITSDGNPPNANGTGQPGNTIGELWLDKSPLIPVLKVYDGVQWVDAGSGGGGSPGIVTLQRWVKTAAGGETSLSGPDNTTQILSYTPGLEEVFLNGVLLTRDVDYFASSGTSITSLSPLTAGDEVTVLGWTPFNVLAAISAEDVIFSPAPAGAVTRSVNNKLKEWVTPEDFGAVGDGVTNDGAAIVAAITSGAAEIYFPQSTYFITSLTANVSNVRLFGPGTVLCTTAGVRLVGDNNEIDGLTVRRTNKSTSSTVQFGNAGFTLQGNNCTIKNVEAFFMNGPGILLDGENQTVDKVYCHDNIMGLRCNPSVRNITITNSRFLYNDVNNGSGADGILMTRSVVGAIVDNCDLGFNGEHGLYFQGQRGSFTNNRVFNNDANGLKFGSYDDGNFEYPGETLDKWVPGSPGVPGYGGVTGADGFGMADIVISDNVIYDNDGGDGVYFQPSSRNVVVDGNTLINNDIRWVYFNGAGGNRLEDHFNVTVSNNLIRGVTANTGNASGMTIAAYSGIMIFGNTVDGRINTEAANGSVAPRLLERTIDPQILNNNCNSIQFSRYQGGLCKGNLAVNLSFVSNGGDADVVGNKVTAAGNLDITRIRVFANNRITCESMRASLSGSITAMTGNDITCTVSDNTSYAIRGNSETTNRAFANGATISGNVFRFNQERGISAGSLGSNHIFSNNSVIPPNTVAAGEWVMRLYGTRHLINGNNFHFGTIRTNGNNANICNNITAGAISDAGSGNTLTNNIIV